MQDFQLKEKTSGVSGIVRVHRYKGGTANQYAALCAAGKHVEANQLLRDNWLGLASEKRNMIVSSTGYGKNIIAKRLASDNTYTGNITHGEIGRGYTAPGAPTVGTGAAGVLTGAYKYKVTFVTATGETEGGTASSTVNPASQQVSVSAIPTGGADVTSRKVYRTLAGGSTYYFLTTIADNVTTTYTDNATDASISSGTTAPTSTTAGARATTLVDTGLQTGQIRAAFTTAAAVNNIVTIRFFFSDATLPNGTYSEFGTFIDGSATLGTGQLFNRATFSSTGYVKATGEDTSIEVEIDVN